MDDGGRSPLGRTLEAFANVVLERTLPRLRQWLTARLGPDADLAGLELDGARVHLVDAVVPLGPHARLRVARATLLTRPEHLVVGLPPVLLETLDGSIVPTRGGPTLELTLERASEVGVDAWLEGRLALSARAFGGSAWEGSAYVRLTSERFTLDAAELRERDGPATVELALRGRLGGAGPTLTEADARLADVRVAVALELRAIFGPIPFGLDHDRRFGGTARLAPDGRLDVELAADGAELALDGWAPPDGTLRAEGRGLLDLGLVRAHEDVACSGPPLALSVRVDGTRREPRVEVVSRGAELDVRAAGADVPLRRIHASVSFATDGIALSLRARVGAGSIHAERSTTGPLRARFDRVPTDALRAALTRAGAGRLAAALEEGQLWADVELGDGRVSGAAQIESPRVSVSLAPLRMSGASLDGSALRIDARAELWDRRARSGSVCAELTLERAPLTRPRELVARGRVRADRVALALWARGEVWVDEARAEICVEDGALSIRAASARVLGGAARAALVVHDVFDRPHVTVEALEVRGCEAGSLVRALTGATFEDLLIDAALERREGALTGTIEARSTRSSLAARAVMRGGRLDGTELEGTIAVADLEPLVRAWTIRPDDAGRWRVEGRAVGTLVDPRVRLEVSADSQRVWAWTRHGAVALDARACAGQVEVTRTRIAWRELRGEGHEGVVRSTGSLAWGGALSARVEAERVAVGRLPLPRGGSLGALVEGTLSGVLDVFSVGGVSVGRGRVRLEEPRYPALSRAARPAAWLELIDERGTRPLESAVRLRADGWTACAMSAAIPRVGARGTVSLAHDGRLSGRLLVTLRDVPMAESLEVPVHVAGTLEAPRADLLATTDALFGGSDAEVPSASVDERATIEELLDELARGSGRAAEVFEALLDRGLHPEAIGARLAGVTGRQSRTCS